MRSWICKRCEHSRSLSLFGANLVSKGSMYFCQVGLMEKRIRLWEEYRTGKPKTWYEKTPPEKCPFRLEHMI